MARGIVGALIGAGLLALVGLVIGLITGIQIGGNYLSDFEFEGARGYIATGNIWSVPEKMEALFMPRVRGCV